MVSAIDENDTKNKSKGSVLAVEWLGPDYKEFVVGFEFGCI
jgi:hypothetical protein